MQFLKQSNSRKEKVEWWLPRPEGGGNESVFHGYKVSVLQNEESCGWMVATVAQEYECTQCHRSLHLKIVKCISPQLKNKVSLSLQMLEFDTEQDEE